MDYSLTDFTSLSDIQDKIDTLSWRRFSLYREIDNANKSGKRWGYASLEEAYRLDPKVREIYQIGEELRRLWVLARMKCASGAAFGVKTRKQGQQDGHRKQ